MSWIASRPRGHNRGVVSDEPAVHVASARGLSPLRLSLSRNCRMVGAAGLQTKPTCLLYKPIGVAIITISPRPLPARRMFVDAPVFSLRFHSGRDLPFWCSAVLWQFSSDRGRLAVVSRTSTRWHIVRNKDRSDVARNRPQSLVEAAGWNGL